MTTTDGGRAAHGAALGAHQSVTVMCANGSRVSGTKIGTEYGTMVGCIGNGAKITKSDTPDRVVDTHGRAC